MNNDIGKANYSNFILMLFSVLATLMTQLMLMVYTMCIYEPTPFNFYLALSNILLSLGLIGPLVYLISFHVYI